MLLVKFPTSSSKDDIQSRTTATFGQLDPAMPVQTYIKTELLPSVAYLQNVGIAVWIQGLVANHRVLYSGLCKLRAGGASDLAASLAQPRRWNVSVMRLMRLADAR